MFKNCNTIPTLLSALLLAYLPGSVFAHSGHIHDEAVQACTDKPKGEKCSYTVANKARYKGSCQTFETRTLCVRSEPIEYLSELAPTDDSLRYSEDKHRKDEP